MTPVACFLHQFFSLIDKFKPLLNRFLKKVKKDSTSLLPQGDCDPSFGAEFTYTIHSKELVVGEIFVRVYNEQPTFVLEVSRYRFFFNFISKQILFWLLQQRLKF